MSEKPYIFCDLPHSQVHDQLPPKYLLYSPQSIIRCYHVVTFTYLVENPTVKDLSFSLIVSSWCKHHLLPMCAWQHLLALNYNTLQFWQLFQYQCLPKLHMHMYKHIILLKLQCNIYEASVQNGKISGFAVSSQQQLKLNLKCCDCTYLNVLPAVKTKKKVLLSAIEVMSG